jgi:hypothetical protein
VIFLTDTPVTERAYGPLASDNAYMFRGIAKTNTGITF